MVITLARQMPLDRVRWTCGQSGVRCCVLTITDAPRTKKALAISTATERTTNVSRTVERPPAHNVENICAAPAAFSQDESP